MASKSIRLLGTLQAVVLCSQVNAQSTTAPSAASPTASTGGSSSRVFIYPKNGQNETQQSTDRYECHTWANNQSGFDPSVPGGGVPPSENSSRRSAYQRAMGACLEARGYSVSFPSTSAATPPPTPPPPPPPPPPRYIVPPVVEHYQAPPPPELKYHPFAVQLDGGYSIPSGTTDQYLDGGANAGLGLTWFPTSALPIGLRVDGSYNWFDARHNLLNANGGGYSSGHEDIYGGDADLQLDLAHRSSRSKFYIFGGAGRYRERTEFRQVSLVNGTVCSFFFGCGPGVFPAVTAVDRSTSPWHNSWNAGLGWETALEDRGSFFIEARFLRILPTDSKTQFVPIRIGFRF